LCYTTVATCSYLGLLDGSLKELQELHDKLHSSDTVRNDACYFLNVREAITRCKYEIKRIQNDIAMFRSIKQSDDSSGISSNLNAPLVFLQQLGSTISGKNLVFHSRFHPENVTGASTGTGTVPYWYQQGLLVHPSIANILSFTSLQYR
jgi:hypothetical protein